MIEEVERLCEDTCHLAASGERVIEGATRLLQGAPGAGKTAILSRLKRKWREDGVAKKRHVPIVVELNAGNLSDPARVATAIAEAVNPQVAKEWRTTRTGDTGVDASAGMMGSGVTGRKSSGSSTRPRDIDFQALSDLVPPETWDSPVCLMVDEIQRIRSEAGDVIDSLHLATYNLPVVPVYAGLGEAFDIVQKYGASRLSRDAVHRIGRLEPGQPAEAVRMMLDGFRIDRGSTVEDWPGLIEGLTDLWPQHLHNALSALARGLVEADRRLRDVDTEAVLDLAERWRRDSYGARMSKEMKSRKTPLARVMADLPEAGLEREESIALVESHVVDRPGWRPPAGMDSEGFLDHLVHQGVLLEGEDGRYTCPIPTFRRYLVERGGLDPDAGSPPPPDNDGLLGKTFTSR